MTKILCDCCEKEIGNIHDNPDLIGGEKDDSI